MLSHSLAALRTALADGHLTAWLAALPEPARAWELLAMASTFAGNLTLLGSVANVIVAEAGREVGGVGFWSFLRVGVPLTVLTTLVGVAWLLWVA